MEFSLVKSNIRLRLMGCTSRAESKVIVVLES